MKLNITTIQFLFIIVFAAAFYSFAQQKSLAEAKLVVDTFLPEKDSVLSVGVLINLKDDWHIYWRNPGDSGLPTEIVFTLPDGFKVSEIKFPTPQIFYSDEIVNYGYEHRVLFISEINIPKNYTQKEILISAKLGSLICKDLCKAFDTTVTIKLDISKNFHPTELISDEFDFTRSTLPITDHNLKLSAVKISDSVVLKIEKSKLDNPEIKSFEFYSYQTGVFKNKAKQTNKELVDHLELVLESDPFRIEEPKELSGIILLNEDQKKAYEINIPIND